MDFSKHNYAKFNYLIFMLAWGVDEALISKKSLRSLSYLYFSSHIGRCCDFEVCKLFNLTFYYVCLINGILEHVILIYQTYLFHFRTNFELS